MMAGRLDSGAVDTKCYAESRKKSERISACVTLSGYTSGTESAVKDSTSSTCTWTIDPLNVAGNWT